MNDRKTIQQRLAYWAELGRQDRIKTDARAEEIRRAFEARKPKES